MSQLTENKQGAPVLIANFEPNEIAKKWGAKKQFTLDYIAQVDQRKRNFYRVNETKYIS
jgi:hypothetical protein